MYSCDPKCLLQGPETSELPKVVSRGCKSCFDLLEKGSPKSLLHQCNPVLHQCNPPAPVQQAFGPHTPKHMLHPLLTTLGNFEVSGPCSRHLGSQIRANLPVSQKCFHRNVSLQKPPMKAAVTLKHNQNINQRRPL